MTKKQKKMLYRILIAAVLFLAAKFIPMPMLVSTALYFAAYVTIGYDILRKAWKGICNHQVFDENFLMAVATIGAIALAIYERAATMPRPWRSCSSTRSASCSRATPSASPAATSRR